MKNPFDSKTNKSIKKKEDIIKNLAELKRRNKAIKNSEIKTKRYYDYDNI